MWIARDKDGDLNAWNVKPLRDTKYLMFRGSINMDINKQTFIHLPKTDFPEVTWENSPVEIKGFALTKGLDLKNKM